MKTVFSNARGQTTGTYNLGNPKPHGDGGWAVQMSGGGSYSVTFRKKVTGSVVADASATVCAYSTAAAPATFATTALTAAGNVFVPAPGCDVIVDVTYTSGACVIEAEPVAT